MKQPFIREMVRDSVAGLVNHPGGGGAASIIAGLFAQGQQGFWLPFTDFASLTQDSAGTLPYTALEQPVGRVLDRSGRGNHASQVTSTARGVASARVNLLQATEVVSLSAPWTSPSGGVTASNNVITFDGQNKTISQTATTFAGIGVSVTATCLLSGSGTIYLAISRAGGGVYEATLLKVTLTDTPQRVSVSHTILNAGQTGFSFAIGTVTDGTARIVTIGEPSLVYSNQAHLPYQRVTTPTDYDSVGFPKYLRLDGTDDSYTCGGGGSTTGFYYSDVIRPNGAGSRTLFYNSVFGLKSGLLISLFSNKFNVAIGNGSAYVPLLSAETLTNGELVHVAAWDDLTNVYLQINGGTIQSMARPAMPAGPPTINLYNTGAFEHYNGNITEPIYRAGPPPSASERATIMGYQKQKAGL